MKKYMKKLSALALALVLMMTAAAPVMAAAPNADNTATGTVAGVPEGLTVTAYKVVTATYENNELKGYVPVLADSIVDATAPTAAEVGALAKRTDELTTTVTMTYNAGEGGYVSDALTAGYWMVLVTGDTGSVVYNPMLLGVYYTEGVASDVLSTENKVDASTKWELKGETAYAKSTPISIDKNIVKEDDSLTKGDSYGVDDTVNFQIATTIPSYSDQYETPVVKIKDELSAGLTLGTDIAVKVDGADANAVANTDYTISTTANGFEITLNDAFIKANGGSKILVTYSAVVNDQAKINFDPNTNKATLEYSNDPSDSTSTKTIDDTSYAYTFGIGAELGGTESWTVETENKELIKFVKVDGDVFDETLNPTDAGYEDMVTNSLLSGATFTLYKEDKTTQVGESKTTGDDGKLSFTGLKEGIYYLKETAAPDGYAIDNTMHKIVIDATYVADGENKGKLESLSISIDGKEATVYKATYVKDNKGTIKAEGNTETTTIYIKNTGSPALPSTGGMGTYLFTIIGVAIMAVAAGMFMTRRRRQA